MARGSSSLGTHPGDWPETLNLVNNMLLVLGIRISCGASCGQLVDPWVVFVSGVCLSGPFTSLIKYSSAICGEAIICVFSNQMWRAGNLYMKRVEITLF